MEVEVTAVGSSGGVTLVRVTGRLIEGEDADALRSTLQELVRSGQVRTIIDLEDTSWFDSTGIGLVISHYVSVVNRGGQVVLLGAGERIRKLFRITRLDDRFHWSSSLEEALERFAQP